jgi:WD40 repeat protein
MMIHCGDWDASFSLTTIQGSASLKPYRRFYDHYFTVSCVASDDTFLATGSNDGCIMVWQMSNTPPASGKGVTPIHRLQGHTGAITCMDIYADEDTIVSGAEDGTCRLYSLAKAKFTRRIHYNNHIPEKVFLFYIHK